MSRGSTPLYSSSVCRLLHRTLRDRTYECTRQEDSDRRTLRPLWTHRGVSRSLGPPLSCLSRSTGGWVTCPSEPRPYSGLFSDSGTVLSGPGPRPHPPPHRLSDSETTGVLRPVTPGQRRLKDRTTRRGRGNPFRVRRGGSGQSDRWMGCGVRWTQGLWFRSRVEYWGVVEWESGILYGLPSPQRFREG